MSTHDGPEAPDDESELWVAALRRIGRLISDTLDASREVGDRHGWRPAEGSEAAGERSHPRLGEGVAMAGHLGWVFMSAPAQEGMETFIDLVARHPPRGFAVYPVARMSLETLSRAWWLFEGDIGAEERASRGLTEILVAMRAQGGRPGSDPNALEVDLARVEEAAKRWGLEPHFAKDGMVSKIDDVDRPKAGALIQDVYEVEGLGQWAYSDTSSMAHGNVVELFKRLSDGQDEHGDFHFVNTRESDLRVLASYLLQAWWLTDLRRVDYLGWHDAEWHDAATEGKAGLESMIEPLTS